MSLTKVTKRFTDYKVKEDRIPIHSKELNTVIDQVNKNETAAAAASAEVVASAAVTAAGTRVTATNVGTASTGTTAVEYGDGHFHKTVLTIDTAFGAIVGGTNLGLGKSIYTLPAGAVGVKISYMDITLDEADGNITTDTPEVGIGNIVAVGAVTDLSTPATFENVITGTAAADCDGTATVLGVVDQPLSVAVAGSHELFLNIAAAWTAGGETALSVTGTVILEWTFLV